MLQLHVLYWRQLISYAIYSNQYIRGTILHMLLLQKLYLVLYGVYVEFYMEFYMEFHMEFMGIYPI